MTKKLLLALGVCVCAASAVLLAIAAPLVTWTNGRGANSVLGQPNFISNTPNSTPDRMDLPWGIAIDPATGKVFVADRDNNRVLRFDSTAALSNGAVPEAILGGTGTGSPSATTMGGPTGVYVDNAGRLWVTEQFFNRLTRYDNAATIPTGTAANAVLGQTDFVTSTAATSQSKMSSPIGVCGDLGGRIWITDFSNRRVVRFDNAAAKANGANADGVLGKADFTTSTAQASQTGMNGTVGCTVDTAGNLWVADTNNNRVLRFANAATLGNGAAASQVLGQPDFTSSTAGVASQSTIQNPEGVAVDPAGRLYVGDLGRSRVLIFDAAATLANGSPASNVLGQTNFTNTGGAVSVNRFSGPRAVTFDPAADTLWVGDSGNNRVLRFGPSITTAANVTVSGRVVNTIGFGVRGATVAFVGSNGTRYTAIANSFGYYSLSNVPAGETYMANVSSRGLVFVPRAVTVTDQLTGVDFSAQ